MTFYLTEGSLIRCCHGGTVSLDSSSKTTVDGERLLIRSGLERKAIEGCPLAGPGVSKCNSVTQVVVGEATDFNKSDPPILDFVLARTDSNPPGVAFAIPQYVSAQPLSNRRSSPTSRKEAAAHDGEQEKSREGFRLTLVLDLSTLPDVNHSSVGNNGAAPTDNKDNASRQSQLFFGGTGRNYRPMVVTLLEVDGGNVKHQTRDVMLRPDEVEYELVFEEIRGRSNAWVVIMPLGNLLDFRDLKYAEGDDVFVLLPENYTANSGATSHKKKGEFPQWEPGGAALQILNGLSEDQLPDWYLFRKPLNIPESGAKVVLKPRFPQLLGLASRCSNLTEVLTTTYRSIHQMESDEAFFRFAEAQICETEYENRRGNKYDDQFEFDRIALSNSFPRGGNIELVLDLSEYNDSLKFESGRMKLRSTGGFLDATLCEAPAFTIVLDYWESRYRKQVRNLGDTIADILRSYLLPETTSQVAYLSQDSQDLREEYKEFTRTAPRFSANFLATETDALDEVVYDSSDNQAYDLLHDVYNQVSDSYQYLEEIGGLCRGEPSLYDHFSGQVSDFLHFIAKDLLNETYERDVDCSLRNEILDSIVNLEKIFKRTYAREEALGLSPGLSITLKIPLRRASRLTALLHAMGEMNLKDSAFVRNNLPTWFIGSEVSEIRIDRKIKESLRPPHKIFMLYRLIALRYSVEKLFRETGGDSESISTKARAANDVFRSVLELTERGYFWGKIDAIGQEEARVFARAHGLPSTDSLESEKLLKKERKAIRNKGAGDRARRKINRKIRALEGLKSKRRELDLVTSRRLGSSITQHRSIYTVVLMKKTGAILASVDVLLRCGTTAELVVKGESQSAAISSLQIPLAFRMVLVGAQPEILLLLAIDFGLDWLVDYFKNDNFLAELVSIMNRSGFCSGRASNWFRDADPKKQPLDRIFDFAMQRNPNSDSSGLAYAELQRQRAFCYLKAAFRPGCGYMLCGMNYLQIAGKYELEFVPFVVIPISSLLQDQTVVVKSQWEGIGDLVIEFDIASESVLPITIKLNKSASSDALSRKSLIPEKPGSSNVADGATISAARGIEDNFENRRIQLAGRISHDFGRVISGSTDLRSKFQDDQSYVVEALSETAGDSSREDATIVYVPSQGDLDSHKLKVFPKSHGELIIVFGVKISGPSPSGEIPITYNAYELAHYVKQQHLDILQRINVAIEFPHLSGKMKIPNDGLAFALIDYEPGKNVGLREEWMRIVRKILLAKSLGS